MNFKVIVLSLLLFVSFHAFPANAQEAKLEERFIWHMADPANEDIQLYWKADERLINNFENLGSWLSKGKRKLVFAMNAGMYKTDYSPLGLFVDNHKIVSKLNTLSGSGNFYMKPNGVFCITGDKRAYVSTTNGFRLTDNIKYATQSGPMLLVNGNIHPAFSRTSKHLNIRNGVGILPDGKIIFAMSKQEVSFYDFAMFFKSFRCANALYLDGFVSQMYYPAKNWLQTSGQFGVMIGITKPLN